jgi:hypothetical protein
MVKNYRIIESLAYKDKEYNSLPMANLTHIVISLFNTPLWLVCVSDCLVYQAVTHTDKSYQMMY